AEEPLGIDRVIAQLFPKLFAQLADVAFHDVLLDVFVEDAIDRAEYLGLGHATAGVACKILQDAALPAWQRQWFAPDLGIAAIHEDAQVAELGIRLVLLHAPADR